MPPASGNLLLTVFQAVTIAAVMLSSTLLFVWLCLSVAAAFQISRSWAVMCFTASPICVFASFSVVAGVPFHVSAPLMALIALPMAVSSVCSVPLVVSTVR